MPQHPKSFSDAELMCAYANGDSQAFEELFNRYRKPLFTFLLQRTQEKGIAEDLFQEVFMRIIRGRSRYKPEGSFRSWLFTIASNALTDTHRKRALPIAPMKNEEGAYSPTSRAHSSEFQSGRTQQTPPSSNNDPSERSQTEELNRTIQSALRDIPEEQREVFLLRQRAGLDFASIAEITGTRLATAKSRMRYALEGLRHLLRSEMASTSEAAHE